MKKNILVGKTEREYVVIKLETEQDYNDGDYLSICGSTYENIFTEEEGEERAREYLEDGESWKMAVENDNTTEGLDDWIEHVLNVDGWRHVLGDVYYLSDIDRYIESHSGGQIDMHIKPENFIEFYIPEDDLKFIWDMWSKYHLKDIKTVPKSKLGRLKSIFIEYESDYENIGKHIDVDDINGS